MNLEKLKSVITDIEVGRELGFSEEDELRLLIRFLYDKSNGSLLKYFLFIDEIEKARKEKENNEKYWAVWDGIHTIAHFSRALSEEKQPMKKLKIYDDMVFGKNIAYVINMVKAAFPKGVSDGASENGKYFFNRFVSNLKEHKEDYLTGESADWAKNFGHYDYIKLILEKN